MPQRSTAAVPDTFVLERTYPRPVELVWSLLSDPAAKRRWFFDDEGTVIDSFDMDFRAGGSEVVRYSFSKGTPVDGLPFVNQGTYLDIVPSERIVHGQVMSINGRAVSAALITYELRSTGAGTALTLTHQAMFLEGADGPAMRQRGWNGLLDKLNAAVSALSQ